MSFPLLCVSVLRVASSFGVGTVFCQPAASGLTSTDDCEYSLTDVATLFSLLYFETVVPFYRLFFLSLFPSLFLSLNDHHAFSVCRLLRFHLFLYWGGGAVGGGAVGGGGGAGGGGGGEGLDCHANSLPDTPGIPPHTEL